MANKKSGDLMALVSPMAHTFAYINITHSYIQSLHNISDTNVMDVTHEKS